MDFVLSNYSSEIMNYFLTDPNILIFPLSGTKCLLCTFTDDLLKQSFADVLQNRRSLKFCKFHRKTSVLEHLLNRKTLLKKKNKLFTECFQWLILELKTNLKSLMIMIPISQKFAKVIPG